MSMADQELWGVIGEYLWQSKSVLRSLETLSLSARGFRAAWLAPPVRAALPDEFAVPADWPARLASSVSRSEGLEMLLDVQLGLSHSLLQLSPLADGEDLLLLRRRRRLQALMDGFQHGESAVHLRQARYLHDETATLLRIYAGGETRRDADHEQKLKSELKRAVERLSAVCAVLGPFDDQWDRSLQNDGSVASLGHRFAAGRLTAEGISARLWLALQQLVESGRRADEAPGQSEARTVLESVASIRAEMQSLEGLLNDVEKQALSVLEPSPPVHRGMPDAEVFFEVAMRKGGAPPSSEGTVVGTESGEQLLESAARETSAERIRRPNVVEEMENAEDVYSATGGSHDPVGKENAVDPVASCRHRTLNPESLPELQSVLRERNKARVRTHHGFQLREASDPRLVPEDEDEVEESNDDDDDDHDEKGDKHSGRPREQEWRSISALLLAARAPSCVEEDQYFE
uniref:Vezatin n=1 Tax=Pinguiococcus pyrenoidosus TaxID=172671 RepID=A0A7R9Y8Y8_9STRA|mmetsp:Transcript_11309/g.42217  ORF Transcript_11309/g.42217 Transcript_11309/m.42217 type:complete len:461 (+) Transcript_11309:84-1466(+)